MTLRGWLTATLLLATVMCSGSGGTSSNDDDPAAHLGAPCTHVAELDAAFPGFALSDASVERGAPECGGGVCLVNHFQGRTTCPLGQAAPESCTPGSTCSGGGSCVPSCTDPNTSCPFVCHEPGSCQAAFDTAANNTGKACCLPGTDIPVLEAVCGQCEEGSHRDATDAVYCSCRCGVAEGAPPEPDYPFCTCRPGFECVEVVPYSTTTNAQASGKYCIKPNTTFTDATTCGAVRGFFDPAQCGGIAAP